MRLKALIWHCGPSPPQALGCAIEDLDYLGVVVISIAQKVRNNRDTQIDK